MNNKKLFTRRNFVKSGITTAGLGIVVKPSFCGNNYQVETFKAPGPIPLNNILADYLQVEDTYGHGLMEITIKNTESWEDKRRSILRRSELMLGEAPRVTSSDILPEVVAEVQRNGYKELKIQFPSGTGDLIKGFLLIPDNTTSLSPKPAIIALHSTGPGASQTAGLTPKKNLSYGMELAQRGYVVLAIDVISAGERIYPGYESYYTNEFYKLFPHWSAMGKMIFDHKKGLDYLCNLDFVDANRLGCIGHSLGGYNSFFLQAFDKRIKAAVSSCGLSTMGKSNNPYQFARDDWFVHFNPLCREYIRSGMIPCDMHEIMALCAPRPFFNYSAKRDSIYDPSSGDEEGDFDDWWQTVDEALNQVAKVYEIYGKPDNLIREVSDGGHDFPEEIREKAYRWLDNMLD
ncbi:MAG: alpha/beta hydrolase family protein [Bacteroidota bacterium]